MTLKELKNKWNNENEKYRTHELGSALHTFVRELLACEELFGLHEGNLSTPLISRKNEFIHEKNAKEGRRADFYIYVNSDIAIPVEVEKYGNISAGESQLLSYQKDFEKHYGILTDGFTWRFYNNNLYKTFSIDTIFDDTELFLTFWKGYIKPEFYYLSFFEKKGQLALTEETKLTVENNRLLFFEDITKLIESFKNKLQIEGYLEATEKKSKKQRATELTYAYIIQFILYKTLVDNDFDDFAKEFDRRVDKIHQDLKGKHYTSILGIIEGISAEISENIYRPFSQEQEFIKSKIQELYHNVENTISDVSPWLDIFVFIKKYNFTNVKNEIFGYIYENYLKEIYDEGKKGQYFTDPAVVSFMLEQIGYTPDVIKKRSEEDKDSISIIDPSCGSGTFLYSSTDAIVSSFHGNTEEISRKIEELITNQVFGLDIEEFPLYLAEMNILMRILPYIISEKYNNPIDKKIKVFKTVDSISEFMDTALRNTLTDASIAFKKSEGQIRLFHDELNLGYKSYVRDEDDLKEMKKSLEGQILVSRRRFDYVIGNPPYISYNECSKQRVSIFEFMKQGKAKLNNIYGINLHSIPDRQKKYAPKPNLYTFFIALGIALLKDNGKICYIIPQTVLVNNDLDVIRYHLAKYVSIERIITFRQKMFIGRGLKQDTPVVTSSLIFVASKKDPDNLHEVEVINYLDSKDNIEDALKNMSIGKKINKTKVLQTKLLQNVGNWNFIKHGKDFISLYDYYRKSTGSIAVYYEHLSAQHTFGNRFYFDGSTNIPKKDLIIDNEDERIDYYTIPSLKSLAYVSGVAGKYPKNKEIKIAQGSQGLVIANPKYKIFWKYINHDKFYYMEGDNILPIYQQYCITSDNKSEILYLLSILNSRTIALILRNLLKVEQEDKLSFLLGLTSIKDFVRIPIINDANIHIKSEVIDLTAKLLDLEKIKLGDLVNSSKILQQKFDAVWVEDNYLVLSKGEEKIRLYIEKNPMLVERTIEESATRGFLFNNKVISLVDLMLTAVVDFKKQQEIKKVIDDLVFCLYFNINIPEDKITNAEFIKNVCEKNQFYKLLEKDQ